MAESQPPIVPISNPEPEAAPDYSRQVALAIEQYAQAENRVAELRAALEQAINASLIFNAAALAAAHSYGVPVSAGGYMSVMVVESGGAATWSIEREEQP